MPTEKPRFSVTFKEESFDRIKQYQKENKISTQSKAVSRLVELALNDIEKSEETEKAPSLSDEAKNVATRYSELDTYGKEAVDGVLDVEYRRCEEEKARILAAKEQSSMETAEEIIPTVMLRQPYTQVAAAECAGAFLLDDGYEEVSVELNRYTQQADVILKVVGRSMEPVISDGDRVLVRQQPSVRIGEIGVFIIDGEGFLKQSAQDRLVSLNDAIEDVLIRDMQNVECYGKFIKVLDPAWVVEK